MSKAQKHQDIDDKLQARLEEILQASGTSPEAS